MIFLRKFLENTPVSGNNVEFAAIPAKFGEHLTEKGLIWAELQLFFAKYVLVLSKHAKC